MTDGSSLRGRGHNLLWSALLLTALALMITTLVLCMRSDADSRQNVTARLVSDQSMVVLRRTPDISSDVSGLIARNRRVTVLEYDPELHPDWALVQEGDTSGWVPLDRLTE